VRCSCAAHDDGKDVDFCAWPLPADSIVQGGVFVADQLSCAREVVVREVLLFPYLNLFNRGVAAASVCVTDVSRFAESDKVRLCAGGFSVRGRISSVRTARHEVRESGERPS
jgi:hypothetical protein